MANYLLTSCRWKAAEITDHATLNANEGIQMHSCRRRPCVGARVHVSGAHERAHPEGGGADRGQGLLRRLARPHHLQQGQVQVGAAVA